MDQKIKTNASKLAHIHIPQCSMTDQCLSRPGGTRTLMFAEIRENHLGYHGNYTAKPCYLILDLKQFFSFLYLVILGLQSGGAAVVFQH